MIRKRSSKKLKMMTAIYSGNTIHYNRVYIAITVSVIAHSLILFIFFTHKNNSLSIENGVRSFDLPRIMVNISKISEPQKVIPAPEKTKQTPVVQQKVVTKIEEPTKEIADEEKFQEAIPIIENAAFKGTRTPPVYPKRALMLRQEGTVILQALIDINGSIQDIKVITSSGYEILDKSAIDAVWKWQFEPSVIDNKPSLSWVQIPVEFIIK